MSVSRPDSGLRLRVLVINPNSAVALTERYVAEVLHAIGRLGLAADVDGVSGTGPPAIESNADALAGVASVLPALQALSDDYDLGVYAAYGDAGREALQEVAAFPIVGITEASAMVAQTLGDRYGVVTTVPRAVRQIEDLLAAASLDKHCSRVLASGVRVLALQRPELILPSLLRTARTLLDDPRCEVICLGCAAMTGLESELSDALGVPVVDGVKAAVGLGLGLLASGLAVNKRGFFAPPAEAGRVGS